MAGQVSPIALTKSTGNIYDRVRKSKHLTVTELTFPTFAVAIVK